MSWSNTLAQLGVLRRNQGRFDEAVAWLGRALTVAAAYNMRVAGQILAVLARLLQEMGEAPFTAAWQQAFSGQPPPLDALKDMLG